MILENEIRIGNFFHHTDNWSYRQPDTNLKDFDFQWNESDWYAIGECTLELKYIEPIHLTPEWLTKAGFEDHNGSFFKIKLGVSEFLINPDNGVVWIENKTGTFNNPSLITELHLLQNIYFALTGEELTISKL